MVQRRVVRSGSHPPTSLPRRVAHPSILRTALPCPTLLTWLTHLLLLQVFEDGLQAGANRLNLRLGFQVDLVVVLGALVRFLSL